MIFEPFGSPEDFKMMEEFIKNKTDEENNFSRYCILTDDFIKNKMDEENTILRDIVFNYDENTVSEYYESDPYFIICCRFYSFSEDYSSFIDTNQKFINVLETIGFNIHHQQYRRSSYLNCFNGGISPIIIARRRYGFQSNKFDLNPNNFSKFTIGDFLYKSIIISLHEKIFDSIEDVYYFFQTDSDVSYYHSGNLPDYNNNFEKDNINYYKNHGLIRTFGGHL